MVFLTDSPGSYDPVQRVEVSDIVLGGNTTNFPNFQLLQLARRDRWLRDQVEALIASLGSSTPIPNSVKLFGGSGGQGNYNLTSGSDTFADGFYYYNNFTVAAGATLNISQFARIFCLGTVTINGTIVISTITSGGNGFATNGAPSANLGGASGAGVGGGSGSGVGGRFYSYAAQPYGSGGGAGIFSGATSDVGSISGGGEGGGGFWIEAAGSITIGSTANISGIGGNAIPGNVSAGVPNISGAGGGSGGTVILSSLTAVSVAGTISVRGGNGANAISGTARGGAAGGGGQIVLIAPTTSTTGATLIISAGSVGSNAGGAGLGAGAGGGNGGAGGPGGGASGAGNNGRLVTRNFRAVG